MKILLTGSSGFIGRNLHNVLLQSEEDIKIIPVARSVGIDLEKVDINELPESDLVIHLAGKVGVLGSWDNPDVFFRSNYISTLNTIGYCRKHSASLIYVSSYMYGNPRYLPIDEKHPLSVNNPYAASKLISEELLIKYADLFGLNLTILRPFNLYGPFMPTENLIQFVFEQLRRTNCVIVRDLEPKRDYLHVEDFCKAIDKVVRRIPTGIEVYN
ncbi:NAD-dependent epimerase/dehydratase family protein, partial [Leptospira bandrabouensis]|uniref:NAD-dependent epimerase/dehydratase family protein n=2 Tax=Leptospira TaxID=171 RepID=UPI001EE956CD